MSAFALQKVEGPLSNDFLSEFGEAFFSGNESELRSHFSDHASGGGASCIARVRGQLAGFVTLRWRSNHPLLWNEHVPIIHQLEVLPRFQRQGIGEALVEEAERIIQPRSKRVVITVGLDAAYGPAQRLYARRGYIPDGRGVCIGHEPVEKGATVEVNDNLILWLLKDLGAV